MVSFQFISAPFRPDLPFWHSFHQHRTKRSAQVLGTKLASQSVREAYRAAFEDRQRYRESNLSLLDALISSFSLLQNMRIGLHLLQFLSQLVAIFDVQRVSGTALFGSEGEDNITTHDDESSVKASEIS